MLKNCYEISNLAFIYQDAYIMFFQKEKATDYLKKMRRKKEIKF
jgi:hypothetical protein